ncbi:MAG: hypothetical protein P8185_11010 [Deltaproteobacteria bacterium]
MANFAEIKQNLDPSFHYIIFEKTVNPADGLDLSEISAFFTRYNKFVIEQEVHRDPTGKHLLLVVKLNADELDEISQEIVNLTFPEDITVYVYGRRPGIENTLSKKAIKTD